MLINEKLYVLAKEHTSHEAAKLVELIDLDSDVDSIDDAKEEFLDVLLTENAITPSEYNEYSVLSLEDELDDYVQEEDDVPETED